MVKLKLFLCIILLTSGICYAGELDDDYQYNGLITMNQNIFVSKNINLSGELYVNNNTEFLRYRGELICNDRANHAIYGTVPDDYPDFPTSKKGDYYTIKINEVGYEGLKTNNLLGKIGGNSGLVVENGNTLLCINNTSTGNLMSVSNNWILVNPTSILHNTQQHITIPQDIVIGDSESKSYVSYWTDPPVVKRNDYHPDDGYQSQFRLKLEGSLNVANQFSSSWDGGRGTVNDFFYPTSRSLVRAGNIYCNKTVELNTAYQEGSQGLPVTKCWDDAGYLLTGLGHTYASLGTSKKTGLSSYLAYSGMLSLYNPNTSKTVEIDGTKGEIIALHSARIGTVTTPNGDFVTGDIVCNRLISDEVSINGTVNSLSLYVDGVSLEDIIINNSITSNFSYLSTTSNYSLDSGLLTGLTPLKLTVGTANTALSVGPLSSLTVNGQTSLNTLYVAGASTFRNALTITRTGATAININGLNSGINISSGNLTIPSGNILMNFGNIEVTGNVDINKSLTVGTSNQFTIDNGGFVTLTSNARAWDDVWYIQTISAKATGVGSFTLNTITGNIKGYSLSVGDNFNSQVEFHHNWAIGTETSTHFHLKSIANDATTRNVKYVFEYTCGNINGPISSPKIVSVNITIPPNTIGNIYAELGDLDYSNITEVSGIVNVNISRISSIGIEPSVDPILDQTGCHGYIDSFGSRKEYSK